MRIFRKLKLMLSGLYRKLFIKPMKILVIGANNSGKTSVIVATFENRVKESKKQKKSTYVYTYENYEFIFKVVIDEPVRENEGKMDILYKRANVVIFVHDSTMDERIKHKEKDIMTSLFFRNMWSKKNLLVLSNKNDLDGTKTVRDVIFELNLIDIADREVACYSVSGKEMVNLNLVRDWIIDQADAMYSK